MAPPPDDGPTAEELLKRAEINAEINRIAAEIKAKYDLTLQTLSEITDKEERRAAVKQNQLEIENKIKDLKQGIIDAEGNSETLDLKKLKNLQTFVEYSKMYLEQSLKAKDISAAEYDAKKKELELLEAKVALAKEEEQTALNTVRSTLNLGNNSKGYYNQLEKINQVSRLNLDNEERKEELLKMQKELVDEVLGKMANIAKSMFALAESLDKNIKGLMRDANFSYEDAMKGIINTQVAMAGAAVPVEKLAASMVSLKENFSDFTKLSGDARERLQAMVATLDKMGLSADASSKLLDVSTKSMGMSLAQSQNFLSSLKGFADQAGISMQRISKDLAGNASELAKFGKQGLTVFKELEVASKQLGIEMSKLVQVTEQFTTFSGAADAAGKFNALLGGDFINSVDLLSASMDDPIQAFAIFKNAMDQSGNSFDEMDNGMKRVMAQAIGMSVEEAGKLFSQDINTATRAMREQAATQEKLNEMSGKMTNFMDLLKSAFVALYPAIMPILDAMQAVGEKIISFSTWLGKLVKDSEIAKGALYGMGIVIFGVTGFILTLTTVLLPFALAWNSLRAIGGIIPLLKGLFAPLGFLSKLLPKAGKDTKEASEEVGKGAPHVTRFAIALSKLGVAAILIGAGIAIAALGLAVLVSSFKGLGDAAWPAAAAVIGFTVAFTIMIAILAKLALSGAGPIAVALLMGIGKASLMIGGGMALAAMGVALVIGALSLLVDSSTELIDAMNDINDDTLGRYTQLVFIFSSLADEIERIGKTGILEQLNSTAFSIVVEKIFGTTTKVQGPATGIALSVGSPSSSGDTSLEQKDQQIVVNVKIDTPINIDGRKLGDWLVEEKRIINAITKKGLEGPRGQQTIGG